MGRESRVESESEFESFFFPDATNRRGQSAFIPRPRRTLNQLSPGKQRENSPSTEYLSLVSPAYSCCLVSCPFPCHHQTHYPKSSPPPSHRSSSQLELVVAVAAAYPPSCYTSCLRLAADDDDAGFESGVSRRRRRKWTNRRGEKVRLTKTRRKSCVDG